MTDTPTYTHPTREWFQREEALTDTLAALVDDGIGYLEACHLVYGDGPGPDATPEARAVWVDHIVRREIDAMVARVPWLRWSA